MKARVALILAASILASSVACADSVRLAGNPSADVIIWRDKDAYYGCKEEQKATGRVGPICYRGALAVVGGGTKVRHVSGWFGFIKVQVLEGRHAGIIGVVPKSYFRPE